MYLHRGSPVPSPSSLSGYAHVAEMLFWNSFLYALTCQRSFVLTAGVSGRLDRSAGVVLDQMLVDRLAGFTMTESLVVAFVDVGVLVDGWFCWRRHFIVELDGLVSGRSHCHGVWSVYVVVRLAFSAARTRNTKHLSQRDIICAQNQPNDRDASFNFRNFRKFREFFKFQSPWRFF